MRVAIPSPARTSSTWVAEMLEFGAGCAANQRPLQSDKQIVGGAGRIEAIEILFSVQHINRVVSHCVAPRRRLIFVRLRARYYGHSRRAKRSALESTPTNVSLRCPSPLGIRSTSQTRFRARL